MESKNTKESLPSTVYVIFISLVIDLLGFTVILPLLPSLLEYYSQHDEEGLYQWLVEKLQVFQKFVGSPDQFNKVFLGGMIGSLFSCLQFLSSPILGALSDVYGRKPILLFSMCGIAMSYVLWACSENFGIFVIARIIGGLSKGNVSISTAVVTDASSSKTRGKAMALVGIAFSIGFIIGPVIGALFALWSKQQEGKFFVIPALFALGLAVVDIIFLAVFFKESLPAEKRSSSIGNGLAEAVHYISPTSLFSFRPVIQVKAEDLRTLQQLGLIYFLYLFIYSGLEYSLTFLTHVRFNYSSMQQGKLLLFSGVIMALIQGGYVRRITPGKEQKTALMGLLLIIPSFILIGISQSQLTLYCGLVIYSFASAVVVPCLTTMVSSYGSADQKGTVLGIFRALGALARAIGPLLASAVFWLFGPLLCYCLGAVLLLLPYFLMRRTCFTLGQEIHKCN